MNNKNKKGHEGIPVVITTVCLLFCLVYPIALFLVPFYDDYDSVTYSNNTVYGRTTVNEIRKQVEVVISDPDDGDPPPTSPNNPALPTLTGLVSQVAWRFLLDKGYDENAAAGVLGNVYKESTFYPDAIQGNHSGPWEDLDNGTTAYGVGLFQWTYYSRKQGFRNYIIQQGTLWTDVMSQLEYFWIEVGTTHGGSSPSSLNNKSIREATLAFHNDFEGSADSQAQLEQRICYAQDIYNKYAGTYTPGGGN